MVVDRYMGLFQLFWEGCLAMWCFDFEDGKAAVATKIIIHVILIGSISFVESQLLHVFMIRKEELLGTYKTSRVGFAAF